MSVASMKGLWRDISKDFLVAGAWDSRRGTHSREAFMASGLMFAVERTPVAIWMLSLTVLTWSSIGSTLS